MTHQSIDTSAGTPAGPETGGVPTRGELETWAAGLLAAAGMPAAHAERTAQCLVTADLWGVTSHGLMRLPFYLRRMRTGAVDPRAELRVVGDTGPLLTLDGRAGLGHWQLWSAAEAACERARRYGVAAVALGNSGHCGALGLYVLPLVQAGMAGIVLSHGPAVMPPWGGTSAVLSTSPVAVGVPVGDAVAADPLIVDLATSAVARGKIAQHAQNGTPLQPGWAFAADGSPTTDPAAALRGMLAPLGGAKGYALALAVEALTAGLIGPALSKDLADMFDPEDADRPQRIAHLLVALDPDRCSVDTTSAERTGALADAVREAGGRLPGERRTPPDRLPAEAPLAVSAATVAELRRWAEDLGVSVPSGVRAPG